MATAVGSVEQAVAGAGLDDHAVVLAMGAGTRGKRELGDGVLDDAELVADVPADAAEVGTLLDFAG